MQAERLPNDGFAVCGRAYDVRVHVSLRSSCACLHDAKTARCAKHVARGFCSRTTRNWRIRQSPATCSLDRAIVDLEMRAAPAARWRLALASSSVVRSSSPP
jgi:hypothetical protein